MAITDSRAIKFCNERVRPIAEQLRALKAEVDALLVDWYGGINALVPNSVTVAPGRESAQVGVGDPAAGRLTLTLTGRYRPTGEPVRLEGIEL